MRTKTFFGWGIFLVLFLVSLTGKAFAQEGKEAIQAQKQDIMQSAQQAKAGERDLLKQIEAARNSGDFQKAKDLRDQLHAMHQENVAEMKDDRQALKESRQEMKEDFKAANPPGVGPGNPPGAGVPPPPGVRDRREDMRDKREDIKDRREDVRDKREDVRDRREDIRDKREDRWDATHNAPKGTEAWRKDKAEDVRDRKEDIRDRKEDKLDRREDKKDKKEDVRDNKTNRGVRDHGAGVGAGKGQGGMHRATQAGGGQRGGGKRR